MNKIILEHYPVEKLDKDVRLRLSVSTDDDITLTVEKKRTASAKSHATLRNHIQSLIGRPQGPAIDRSEIRIMRDEWN